MRKPTYYLWYNHFSTQDEYEQTKERIVRQGFRVVTYFDGAEGRNIHDGLKRLIKNHYSEIEV